MQKKSKLNYLLWALKIIPLIVFIGVVVMIVTGKNFSVESVLKYTPDNYFLAALVVLAFYTIKSMSFLLPIVILYIVGGTIFPWYWALIINTAGTMLCTVIPYWVGYYTGGGFTDKMIDKYPKFKDFFDQKRNNQWFISYFLRIINCLPIDAISMYLGTQKFSFYKYLIGSTFGSLPGVITATLIGVNITDPTSPMFMLSVIITVLLSFISLFFYKRLNNKKEEKNEE